MSRSRRSRVEAERTKAVIYARVSSKDQEREGFSIPAQIKLLRGYAQEHGIRVMREFVDVETAKRSGRAGFSGLLAFLRKAATCRILLVEKTDRLYRNFKDWVTLDEFDLEIHLVKENAVISRDSRSHEKFVHGIKVLMAKQYIDNLGEEAAKGMREKAEQGMWPSGAPVGYRNCHGENGKRVIEPDLEMAPLVTRVFEWYASGKHSLEEVTSMAAEAGLVSNRSGRPLPRGSVHRLLKNPLYFGEFTWSGVTYVGTYPPLVSRDLWERVQDVLRGNDAAKTRRVKREFAFSRLIRCGHCGCSLVGEEKKGRYVYYHCTGYKGRCPEPYVREEVLEERFAQVLQRLSFDADVMAWIAEGLRLSHEEERRFHDQAVARLQSEYTTLQRRIDSMYEDKLDGRISAEYFDRRAAEWRREQVRIRNALAEHEGANQGYLEDGVRLLELARKAHRLFEGLESKEKRRLLGFLLSNSSWKNGELSVEFRQPFADLAVATETYRARPAEARPPIGDCHEWRERRDSNSRPPA